MIRVILWDIDNTILSFDAAEKAALNKEFEEFELGEFNDEMLQCYVSINRKYWQALERGEITKYLCHFVSLSSLNRSIHFHCAWSFISRAVTRSTN